MTQSDIGDFILALINCNNTNSEIQKQSEEFLFKVKEQDFFGYLNALLLVIQEASVDQLPKNLALILSWKTLQDITLQDPTISKYQFIEDNSPGLLEHYLTTSMSLFSTLSLQSANLFSCVTSIVARFNEQCDIIKSLLEQLDSTTDFDFFTGAFYALFNITEEFDLEPENYQPILSKIFTIFNDQEVPLEIKSLSLKILSNMIKMITDVFENEQNFETITSVIKYSVNEPSLKESGYKCLSQLVKYHFPAFAAIAEEVVAISIDDLEKYCEDESIIVAIIYMIKKLAKDYDDDFNESRVEVLSQSFPLYFEPLLRIAIAHDDGPSDPDSFDPSIASCDLLGYIVKLVPSVAMEPLLEFIQANVQSDNPPLKEMALLLCSYAVPLFETNEPIPNFLELFPSILGDPNPRIVETALFLLQKIISRYYDDFQQQIWTYSQPLLEILSKATDIPVVASEICVTLSMIKNLPNCKDVITEMLQYGSTESQLFSRVLFESIKKIIEETSDYNKISEMIPYLVDYAKLGMTEQGLQHNRSDILFMFSAICLKSDKFISNYFSDIYPLLVQCYEQTQDIEALNCLTNIATSMVSEFDQFLPELMENIFQLFGDPYNNENINCISDLLYNLNHYFTLTDYVHNFTEAIFGVLQEREKDLTVYSELLEVLSMFFSKYFEQIEDAVVPIVRLVSNVVLILEDVKSFDYEKNRFISVVTNFINVLLTQCDGQISVQWFEFGFKILESAANSIDLEADEEESKYPIKVYAELISILFNMNESDFCELVEQNQEILSFIFKLNGYQDCHDNLPEPFRKMQDDDDDE